MICKILLFFLTLGFAMPLASFAEDLYVVTSWDRSVLLDGCYVGKMDVTMSKDKSFKGREATFQIKGEKLLSDFPKIGKMPGKIKIELPVRLLQNGVVTAQPECIAGVMRMPLGIKLDLKLDALENARIIGNQIFFTLKVYSKFMGAKFPTTISFKGYKK